MPRKYISIFLFSLCCYWGFSQTTYPIDIRVPEKKILKGHLDLGGSSPAGDSISVNSYFIEKNGKPFFPVIGEFHYARFAHEFWEEEILKMKAGGINTIASYVFWNLHEREEGSFDWEEDLNLRKFVQLINKHNLYAIVRLGPFCHGEMRNGGIPDWLYGRAFEIRSNDKEYLEYVNILYGEIAQQINGLLYKDGGPVIGVQLENEYQHAAAPWEWSYQGSRYERTSADWDAAIVHDQITVTDGENPWFVYGRSHMANLKKIAKENGIDVPLYTATGWGNATIVEKGSIPVTAGYVYPFWSSPKPSPFYLFKDIQTNPDYQPISYQAELYPSIAAEIGPGIQPKYSRRPIVEYNSVNPLMMRIVGSGSNGIGYYMYHGGSTPSFDGKYYNEAFNGMPRIHYDFQAPIGQYGQVRYHWKHLRMLHSFLDAFGETLAPMKTVLPQGHDTLKPENTGTLRYAVRSTGDAGFLFVLNFQDHIAMQDIDDVRIEVKTESGNIAFPAQGTMDVKVATSAIFPFNLTLGKAKLHSATVQPFTILKRDNGNHVIFSAIDGLEAELNFPAKTKIKNTNNALVQKANGLITVKAKEAGIFSFQANGETILVIPQEMALNAQNINESLYITESVLLKNQGNFEFISRKTNNKLHIYPGEAMRSEQSAVTLREEAPVFEGFSSWTVMFDEVKPDISIDKVSEKKYTLRLNSDISMLNDLFVHIDYVGDHAAAFIDGIMVTDHLYQERAWEIGLKSIVSRLEGKEMLLKFNPMTEKSSFLIDMTKEVEFEKGKYLKINGFEFEPEYKAVLTKTKD